MPLVQATIKPGVLDEFEEKKLARVLKDAVATALTCADDGGRLEAGDIEVRFQDVGTRHYGASPLSIQIFANDFPSRKANIQERTTQLAQVLRASPAMPEGLLTGNTSFVWILLCPAGFARF